MKNLTTIFTLALITISSAIMAQDFEVPKTGAKIYVENNTIELNTNGEFTFDLWIARSKKAQRAKFDVPRFSGSKELEISLEANTDNIDNYKVTVKTEDVATGKYFYTVTSRTTGIQRINGTTISFVVAAGKPGVASTNGN